MSVDLSEEVVNVASAALERCNMEKNIAAQIRTEFRQATRAHWHVLVDRNFHSCVTHETKQFIFYIGSHTMLIWTS
ncbi:dynein light chain type 1-domain-containing protein [Earliella scabrosa]|nr:dynein light chain type 1-domain-containing protein [Earliella scabrosa]